MTRFAVFLAFFIALAVSPARADRPFVFVHGAWVGEWYWSPIVAALQAEDRAAYAVSLKGHGERAAENGPDVALPDHVDDIVAVITDNDLHDVILVAHSYGGRPATGAWDRARDRIGALVFFEAIAPYKPGRKVIPKDRSSLGALLRSEPDIIEAGVFPPPPELSESARGPLSPHSLNALYGEIVLTAPLPRTPGTYVLGTRSHATQFRDYATHVRVQRGWRLEQLDSGHDFVGDAPEALVDFLLKLP